MEGYSLAMPADEDKLANSVMTDVNQGDRPMFIVTLANFGPNVWFAREEDSAIYGADLQVGNPSIVGRASAGFSDHLQADSSHVFWGDWMAHGNDRSSWAIDRLDTSTGDVTTVASGDSKWTGLMSEVGPKLGLGHDVLAYAIGAPTEANPLASRIIVQNATDGSPIRDIDADGVVWDIAVGDGVVAYSVGDVDPKVMDDTFNLRLHVSRDADPDPVLLAQHAFEVNIDDNWLVWNSRPDSPDLPSGRFGVVVATKLDDLKPQTISSSDTENGTSGAWIASAGDGIAAWSEVAGDTAKLVAWNEASGQTVDVANAEIQFLPSVGGRWLAWPVHTELHPGYKTEAMLACR